MGCASSHSVENVEQRIVTAQRTIDHMKIQMESQGVAIQDIEMRQQAIIRQFKDQVSEHVSLCADFKTFIDIAREHEQIPQEIMERVELLESRIESVVRDKLNKVQEQLHNLESSVNLDESFPQTNVNAIVSELQNVQQKVFHLEAHLLSDERAADHVANVSGDSIEEENVHFKTEEDCTDDDASEKALETLFMRISPDLNRSTISAHDYDVAGVLDFALLEPEDAFEAEISSITARLYVHTRLMKSPQIFPPGFAEPISKTWTSSNDHLLNGEVQEQDSQLHFASRRNIHAANIMRGAQEAAALTVKPSVEGYSSDNSDS
jgi:hypothetical protein